jgi:hypothetical protein
MQRFLLSLLSLLLILGVAAPLCRAADGPDVSIVEYGLYAAELTDSGLAGEFRLVESTDRILLAPDTLFGIRYQYARHSASSDATPLHLSIEVRHPPMPDPETGDMHTSYSLSADIRPGERRFQGQRLPAGPPEPPTGEYVFTILHNGAVLASQTFHVLPTAAAPTPKAETAPTATAETAPPAPPEPPAGILVPEAHSLCRGLNPADIAPAFGQAHVLPEHSFGLRLPDPDSGADTFRPACFLALADGHGAGYAITTTSGKLLRVLEASEPLEPNRQVLAVSFTETGGDLWPEIVVIAEDASQTPPRMDSRVYFSTGKGPNWERRPEVDAHVARLGNATAVRRWLAQWDGSARVGNIQTGESQDRP